MMKKIGLILVGLMLITGQAFAVNQWRSDGSEATIKGGENASDIDAASNANIVVPIDRMLANYIQGLQILYSSASSLTISKGEAMLSNSGGTARLMQQNTTSTAVGWAQIDTGAEVTSTTYYIYAYQNTTSTFTMSFFISTSSSAPIGATYYLRLGSFFNNSSGDIERIVNDNYTTQWKIDGTETQLDQADAIDMQSEKIINLADPTNAQDAATMTWVETTASVSDATITQAKLKTAIGEVSTTAQGADLTLPGGTYGFYPQLKGNFSQSNGAQTSLAEIENLANYTTNIYLFAGSGTVYAQQRYVTASGQDYWIFLKIDKTTKDISGAWAAPDHPSYGNGGDPVKLSQPFGSYDKTKNYIVLVEKTNVEELRAEAKDKDTSLLTLINEDYKVNWGSPQKYVPLHSGKFLGEAPVLIDTLPSYIKVRKLEKLTDADKLAKETKQDTDRTARELKKSNRLLKLKSAKDKLKLLGLDTEEVEILFSNN